MILPPRNRSASCKFRLGIAPIRIETVRHDGLPEESRICPVCDTKSIENEKHIMLNCPVCYDFRSALFYKAFAYNVNFISMSDNDK